MDNSIFKIVELVGSSEISIEDAVQIAITRASKSIQDMQWFKIKEVRGNIENNKLIYQVVFKVGFEVNDNLDHNLINHQERFDIKSHSPAKDKQTDFISEGGNNQPLTTNSSSD